MRILVYTGKGGVGKTSVAAPTGETLRLLSFPDVMRWWMQRIFPIQRRAMGLARPLIGTFVDIPLPTEQVYDSVERLFVQLATLHAMLIDPKLTSIRLVLIRRRWSSAKRSVLRRTFICLGIRWTWWWPIASCRAR